MEKMTLQEMMDKYNTNNIGDAYINWFVDRYDIPEITDGEIEEFWEKEFGESIDPKLIRDFYSKFKKK